MKLDDFCELDMAQSAGLSKAEVAALRLYSGPMHQPINKALRNEDINDWATTIACCYSGVLKLSFCSQPARVYRGVRETDMTLPPQFVERAEGKFAGGVERAFMSTTRSAAVAIDYSGMLEGGRGHACSIFCLEFDMTSRGASLQFLSQYPVPRAAPPSAQAACVIFCTKTFTSAGASPRGENRRTSAKSSASARQNALSAAACLISMCEI